MIAHVSLWQLNNGQVYLDLCLSILISISCLSHTLMEEFLDLLTNLIMITEWFKAVSSGQTKQSLWLINYASIAWVTNGCICSQENRKSCLELVLNTESWAFSIFSIVAIKQQFILFQVIYLNYWLIGYFMFGSLFDELFVLLLALHGYTY